MDEKRIGRYVGGHSVVVTNSWRGGEPRDEVWVALEDRYEVLTLWMSEVEFRAIALAVLDVLEKYHEAPSLFDQEQLEALSNAPAFSGKDEFLAWASKQRKETV